MTRDSFGNEEDLLGGIGGEGFGRLYCWKLHVWPGCGHWLQVGLRVTRTPPVARVLLSICEFLLSISFAKSIISQREDQRVECYFRHSSSSPLPEWSTNKSVYWVILLQIELENFLVEISLHRRRYSFSNRDFSFYQLIDSQWRYVIVSFPIPSPIALRRGKPQSNRRTTTPGKGIGHRHPLRIV